jgi:bis(5'-nucleosyl)-tetraphosphatase (symmetrical)
MATYAIGDVQGCFDGLMQLLDLISFNPQKDELIFLGDVVNRGDKSLETLNFIKHIDAKVVLGNHDYHLLACYFGVATPNKKDTFGDVLSAKNTTELIDFLLTRNIIYTQDKVMFVHAGIPPLFTNNVAQDISEQMQQELAANPERFIRNTYGNQSMYDKTTTQELQFQYYINSFMRMRFCKQNGELDFSVKQHIAPQHIVSMGFKPWFECNTMLDDDTAIYFGHWSALTNIKDISSNITLYPLDTGFIWGGSLSCIRLSDNTIFSIK